MQKLEGRTLTRHLKLLPALLFVTAVSSPPLARAQSNPAESMRSARPWHFGPFVNYANGVGDRSGFHFLSAGAEAGKALTPVLHAGPLSGQFDLSANIMPLWSAYTPAPHTETRTCIDTGGNTYSCELPVGGGNYFGVSVTPVIFRWKFATPLKILQPWFQGQGGLIYTSHKFPPDVLVPHGMPGGTSVWNFASGAGLGTHIFTGSRRSIDLQVNAVHISSASLGDKNPGVNASIQVQVGYTFWK